MAALLEMVGRMATVINIPSAIQELVHGTVWAHIGIGVTAKVTRN